MKKFFLIALSVLSLNAFAGTDEVSLEPVKAPAGTATMMWVNINLPSYENELRAINVDIQFPDGFTVGTTAQDWGEGCKWDYDFDEPGTATNWSLSGSKKTDNGTYYHFTVYANTPDAPFHGKSGRLFQLKVKTPAAAGVYPVKVLPSTYATKSDKDAENLNWENAQTSFVVVGEASDATLALEGDIASFVNEALASETAIGTLDLTKATASNGTFTYVDGRKVIAPEGLKGKVAYKRSVSGLASVCLPFAADIKAYTYTEMAGEYAIFDEVSNLAANTPAIVNANIDITVADATIGSVEGKTINSGYYLKGGNLCKVNGSAKIAPLRGCWDITAPVKGFKFNDADAILTVDANANEDIFNLNGVKLNKAQRGVNIIGGKKVMK